MINKEKIESKSQAQVVLKHLRDEGSITSIEAFERYGITRLAAVVWNLRKDDTLNIETVDETCRNRYGNTVTYARYILHE